MVAGANACLQRIQRSMPCAHAVCVAACVCELPSQRGFNGGHPTPAATMRTKHPAPAWQRPSQKAAAKQRTPARHKPIMHPPRHPPRHPPNCLEPPPTWPTSRSPSTMSLRARSADPMRPRTNTISRTRPRCSHTCQRGGRGGVGWGDVCTAVMGGGARGLAHSCGGGGWAAVCKGLLCAHGTCIQTRVRA